MKPAIVLVLASFASLAATLCALGCFDPPAPSKPIQVQTIDCRAELGACGTEHKCWSAYHACIGAGGLGDAF